MTFRQIVQYVLHPRRWGRAMVSAFFALIAAIAVLVGALLFVLPGKTLALPEWVMLRIEEAVAQNLPAFQFGYDTAAVEIAEDFTPTIVMKNLSLVSRKDGRSAARIGDVNFHVDMGALIAGRAEISHVDIDGVFIAARRNAEGVIDLGLGKFEGAENTQFKIEDVQSFLHENLKSTNFAALSGIDVQNVSIEYQDARANQVWLIDGGLISLAKAPDGSLALRGDFVLLGARSYASSFVANIKSKNSEEPVEFGFQISDVPAQDLASQAGALAWLKPVIAPISGALRGSYQNGAVRGLNATLQIGQGVLQPNEQSRPISFEKAHTYFTYDEAKRTFVFGDIQVQAKNLSLSAEGLAQLEWPEGAAFPKGMITQLRMENFVLNAQDYTPKPVGLDKAHADFRLTLDPFQVELGEFLGYVRDVSDPVQASGWAKTDETGWSAQLNGSIAALELSEVTSRWPSTVKPKTLNWITQHILVAKAKDVHFAAVLKPGKKPETYLSFGFKDAVVQPLNDMPAVTDGAGVFELFQHRLAVFVEKGSMGQDGKGNLDVSGTSFVIPDVREKEGPGIADIGVKGDISALMAVLDTGKIKLLSRIKQPFDFMKGRVEGRANIKFPRRKGVKFDEISLSANASVIDAKTSVYGGGELDIPRGELQLENKALRISGKGTWSKIAFDGVFKTKLAANSPITIEARPKIDEAAVRKFVPGLAKGMVSGTTGGDLLISLGAGKSPKFKLTSALRGMSLNVATLALQKPSKEAAKFTISGPLSSGKVDYDIALEARAFDIAGKVSLANGQKLSQISLAALRLGNWFKGALTMSPVQQGMFDVSVSKGNADFRKFPASLGSSSKASKSGFIRNMNVTLDRLIVSEGIALTGIKGDLAMVGGVKGPFTARLNNRAPLSGQIKRFDAGSGVEIRSNDAGAVLAAGDLMKKARGGDLFLSMTPTGQSGTFDGALNVKNVRMLDAPAMVELLNALSIIGLLNQLNEKGLLLQEVEARFRLTPTQVILRRSSAFGPALGMSLDGYYTLGAGVMDMQGVLSPLFIVNGIGSPLTRKGEGLLGFSFILKGTSDKPKVKVNPLSIFTPGMFREIFRRPPPKYESDQ